MKCCEQMCRVDHTEDEMLRAHHKDCPEWNKKKARFKLSPELVDGEHWIIVDSLNDIKNSIHDWYHNEKQADFTDGEHFSVEICYMSDREAEELPDI